MHAALGMSPGKRRTDSDLIRQLRIKTKIFPFLKIVEECERKDEQTHLPTLACLRFVSESHIVVYFPLTEFYKYFL